MSERPTALVTGASRGLGAAIARALAPDYDLVLGGRGGADLALMCAELDARPLSVDLTALSPFDVAGVGRVDLLVHSAGMVKLGSVEDTPAEVWRATYELNVIAVAELTRLLLPELRATRGHVVIINSGAGLRAHPGWVSYAASKFALRAFADVLRQEEAPHGIRVTTIYPGRMATDMQREVREQEGGEFQPDRYLTPDSVARAVLAAVTTSPDAHLTEITIRPSAQPPHQ
ncbi:short chain dehydrogenase [Acrocarpospora pleiomorpha]|uniref:Short chain dehydrogenase n=1 Tax=Acrocarpospora pleiomorpha TaxID=90975 RepID=A0A5M3XQ74_9ACTN|nr:SDR family oxidoreductase [Acrocarpospora pleiomorpha]GES21801.1 short chain dehydrogenase [Acrocarpospora pleiomorpha]